MVLVYFLRVTRKRWTTHFKKIIGKVRCKITLQLLIEKHKQKKTLYINIFILDQFIELTHPIIINGATASPVNENGCHLNGKVEKVDASNWPVRFVLVFWKTKISKYTSRQYVCFLLCWSIHFYCQLSVFSSTRRGIINMMLCLAKTNTNLNTEKTGFFYTVTE